MGRQVVGFFHEFYKFYYFRSGSIDRANSIYSYEEKNKNRKKIFSRILEIALLFEIRSSSN